MVYCMQSICISWETTSLISGRFVCFSYCGRYFISVVSRGSPSRYSAPSLAFVYLIPGSGSNAPTPTWRPSVHLQDGAGRRSRFRVGHQNTEKDVTLYWWNRRLRRTKSSRLRTCWILPFSSAHILSRCYRLPVGRNRCHHYHRRYHFQRKDCQYLCQSCTLPSHDELRGGCRNFLVQQQRGCLFDYLSSCNCQDVQSLTTANRVRNFGRQGGKIGQKSVDGMMIFLWCFDHPSYAATCP